MIRIVKGLNSQKLLELKKNDTNINTTDALFLKLTYNNIIYPYKYVVLRCVKGIFVLKKNNPNTAL